MIPPLLAICVWPIAVMIFFRRYDLVRATVLALLLGFLFLPERTGINLPAFPTLNKNSVPALAALAMGFVILRQMPRARSAELLASGKILPGVLPSSKLILGLLALLVGGALLTALVNDDPLPFATRSLPGLSTYDGLSFALTAVMGVLPLLLARKYLAHPDAHRTFLVILTLAAAGYALLALYEVRMSPQLSNQIYGISVRSWLQQVRNDGFRPVVFLDHGLRLAVVFASAAMAAFALWRLSKPPESIRYLLAALLILVTITLSKSLGALMIVVALLPVVLFTGVRVQILVAAAVSMIVLLYPLLRSADLVPVDRVVEFARGISPERAGSLQFRLKNEDILLEKAMQRPVLGWGGWGRARVFDEDGNDISVTDGSWVISIGLGGFVRYFGEFGLLTIGPLLLAFRRRQLGLTLATSGLCLALAANLIDLIPNSGLSPLTMMLAGALIGRLELGRLPSQDQEQAVLSPQPKRAGRSRADPEAIPPPAGSDGLARPGPRYTRFAPKTSKGKP